MRQGFDHAAVALSVGMQHMVRSDLGASGVMFTLDTDSGFRNVMLITASWASARRSCRARWIPTSTAAAALRSGKYPVLRP